LAVATSQLFSGNPDVEKIMGLEVQLSDKVPA
jgi:hypothetical protein